MVTNKSGIYMIKNTKNGKVYIGQSQNIQRRINAHISCLRRGAHYNKHLQRAWDMYGESVFEFSTLELCDLSVIDDREMFYIGLYHSASDGYNCTDGGGGIRGYEQSAETKAKMSESHADVSGNNNPRAISVTLVNTGEAFDCIQYASEKYGVCKGDISKNAKRKSHSAGEINGVRLVWAYTDDFIRMDSLEKMRLIITAQNCKSGENCHRSTNVICLSTGVTYFSIRDASQRTGIGETSISAACRGIQNSAGGMMWAYSEQMRKDAATDEQSSLLAG